MEAGTRIVVTERTEIRLHSKRGQRASLVVRPGWRGAVIDKPATSAEFIPGTVFVKLDHCNGAWSYIEMDRIRALSIVERVGEL